jgi:cellulose synthase/poly-beta-1,6-N-acetylglucosamine synthase-like glycosyltransferase
MNMVLGVCFAAAVFGFLYPFVIYPVLLNFVPAARPISRSGEPVSDTTVALLFSVYNEEKSLPAKIENLRDLKKSVPQLDIHVYTDQCTDASVELLQEAEDLLTIHEATSRTGKAAGMKRMVAEVEADILVFTDANVILDPGSIRNLLRYFADESIGTVAGRLFYTNPDSNVVAHTGSMYWRLEEYIKRQESRTGSMMGADGSIFAIRRSLYPDVREDLMDDLIASISPIFSGHRVIIADDVHAFEKSTTSSSDEFGRKRRIGCRAFNTHRFLSPQLKKMSLFNKFKYFSHKYLRWFSFVFLGLSVLLGTLVLKETLGWGAAIAVDLVGFGLLLVGRFMHAPLLSSVAETLLAITATGIGVVEALFGRNYTIWSPAKSRE